MDRDQLPVGLGPSPLTSPTRRSMVAASEAEVVTPAEEKGIEALGATKGSGVATAETRPPRAAPSNPPWIGRRTILEEGEKKKITRKKILSM